MEKQVLAICDFDKAEAFVGEFLDRPFGHVSSYVIEMKDRKDFVLGNHCPKRSFPNAHKFTKIF
jgi:hypothetical protein